jgi:hypothetical protein
MKSFIVVLLVSCCISSVAQKTPVEPAPADLTTLKYTVEEATDWNAMLKRKSGWFGGDGIYTIPLNGKEHQQAKGNSKILFLFSDSMIGEITDNTMQPGHKMIHNAVGILNGGEAEYAKMNFYWEKDSTGKAESVFIPKTPKTEKHDYYWLGDGFVNQELNNNIYVFGYRVRNIASGPFGFKEVGNTIIKIPANDKPPYAKQQQMDSPFFLTDDKGDVGSFGAGIYVNTKGAGAPAPDGYIYVYGVDGKWKNLLVARVLPKEFEDFTKWTYFDGTNWDTDIKKAQKVANWVSNELSVTALPDGRYALIFQVGGMSKDIGLRIGKTPYGPFGPVIKIWDCQKDLAEKTYLVYNAKAHPSISKPGELIISYNINSTEFMNDLKKDPNLYRPRFIRLKFN